MSRPRSSSSRIAAIVLGLGGCLLGAEAVSGTPTTSVVEPSFERDIRPILKAHCFHCHGEGEKLQGGVDLRLRRFLLRSSDSGPVVTPGNPDASVLLKVVASGEMPKADKKLAPEQVDRIRRWVRAGAPTLRPEPENVPRFFISEEEREFWAFQPIIRPTPPEVRGRGSDERVSAVDRFLLARLEERGLSFARAASRAVLARRVSFDLIGLPPDPAEVEAFVQDEDPEAYERWVDRLLASPRFGERWGRHWLDVAGYADSNGGPESDSDRPWAWRYRDYVVRSLNADKPFDRFITEQLAGDEMVSPPYEALEGEALDCLVATGFLRQAPDPTGDHPADAPLARNQVIADTLQIVSTSLLGLTVQCAQCHDHRYDPIPQSDYYRLRAVFEPAFDWQQWRTPDARSVSLWNDDERKRAEAIEKEAAVIDREAQKLHDEFIEAFVQRQLLLVPESRRAEVLAARRTPAGQRSPRQLEILREFPTFQDNILLGEIDRDGAKKVDEVRQRAAAVRAKKPAENRVHALVEQPGRAPETFLFHRGDHQQPKEAIPPGGLSVLEGRAMAEIPRTNMTLRTTGRRLAFARHLTDGRHPLVPRVLVNRFWHHLFGAGLVRTLGDFGSLGERPSHPELLDWLAAQFMADGWRLKPFLRRLVLSEAYRQETANPKARELDPDNRLLARQSLRRLDAESVRDAMIAVTGNSELGMFGKPVPIAYSAEGQVIVGVQNRDGNGDPTTAAAAGADEYRRSVYVTVKRSAPVGLMETFDAPLANPNCEVRASSTVPLQSLTLMNDPFVLARSAELARRVRRSEPEALDRQVRLAWRSVYGETPSDDECRRGVEFLRTQVADMAARAGSSGSSGSGGRAPVGELALSSYCQALLSANRFLYLE